MKIIKRKSVSKCLIFLFLLLGIISARAQSVTNTPAKPKWVGDISAGLTLTRGNSDTTLANFTANGDRKTDVDELLLGANATYGKATVTVDGVSTSSTTAQNAGGFTQYNWLFTPRLYAYIRVEGYHDDIADIHYRVTVGPGVGYYFIKNTRMDLSGEAGPGYISQSIGSSDQNFVTLRVAQKFHYKLSDRARLWETVEITPDLQNIQSYIVTAEIGIAADLNNKNLSLNVFLDDNYQSQPAPGRQKNDSKLVAAIDYTF